MGSVSLRALAAALLEQMDPEKYPLMQRYHVIRVDEISGEELEAARAIVTAMHRAVDELRGEEEG